MNDKTQNKLLEFYGQECPHCNRMHPLVDKLEQEAGLKVEKYETWHNEDNAKLLSKYDQGFCGGVPFFFNEASGQWICGEVGYDDLKLWATGK